jgi:hypothetical protein
MNIELDVDTGNGPRRLTATMWAVVQWERKFKVKASDMAKSMGAEDLAFLAYCAEQAGGNTVPAMFDDYMRKIRSLDVVAAEPENPTQGEAPAEL